jgi:ribosomal-protein-alanine N-acetyltransferase
MFFAERIEGNRLRLKCLEVADVSEAYVAWMNDIRVVEFLEARLHGSNSMAGVHGFVRECVESSDVLLFGMFERENGTHIGNVKIGPINWYHRFGEIGFLIGETAFWGNGYATEGVRLACNFAWHTLGLARLSAGCYEPNHGSHRVLLKCGFLEEGCERKRFLLNECRVDGLRFGLLNPELR